MKKNLEDLIDLSKYQSPVEVYMGDMDVVSFTKKMNEEIDNQICYEIQQKFCVDVNNEELMKALKYDRGQYEKGFREGRESAPVSEWISVDINPPRADNYLVVIEDVAAFERFADVATYCGNGLWQMSEDTILCSKEPRVIFWAHVNIPEKEEK